MKAKTLCLVILLSISSFIAGYKGKLFIHKHIVKNLTSARFDTPTIKDYTQVNCPEKPITIATFGQSNSSNYVQPKSETGFPINLFQYDWRSRKCYKYREPLLGTDGHHGNAITYTAVEIANNNNKDVLIVPFGMGGTSILQWAYGYLSHQLDFALSHMKSDKIEPLVFLWHQGEGDSKDNRYRISDLVDESKKDIYFKDVRSTNYNRLGLSSSDYASALNHIHDKIINSFPKSKLGIALVSKCDTNRGIWDPIRSAQKSIAESYTSAFISADSDKIFEDSDRYDGCHFSSTGAKKIGSEYLKSIKLNTIGIN